jgi:hypothetical protein
MNMRVDAELKRPATRVFHLEPNPRRLRISMRNNQTTESKALDVSSFRKRLGTFFLWSLIVCCTNIKLLCMHLPQMKALWLVATKELRSGANRLAMIFVMSLAKLCIKLIGWKSFAETTSSFFYIRVR